MTILAMAVMSIFIWIGLGMLVYGYRNIDNSMASRKWPSVEGAVVESRTESKGEHSAPSIRVRYRVGSAEHETANIRFGQFLGSTDSSEAELERLRYPVGSKVRVSYDPGRPGLSVIKPGLHADALWLPGSALGFIAVGVMFMLAFRGVEDDSIMGIALGMFAGIFACIGVAMFVPGCIRLWNANASLQWPKADGEIVYAAEDRSSSTSRSGSGYERTSVSYSANLVFRYEVAGRVHYSNLRRFGQLAGSSEEWAAEIARRFPKGTKLPVAYHPGDPDIGVVETGIGDEAYWLPGAGLAFLLFGLAVVVWGIPALTSKFV